MRIFIKLLDRLALHAYCAIVRMLQLPTILRERTPRFLDDEVLRPAEGARYAIVVKYAGFGVAQDFLDLLDALRRGGINAIVVCNGELRPDERSRVAALAHRILTRENIGRDMGAYRAATLHLKRSGLRPDRMLYFNDSVIYVAGAALDALVARLGESGGYDITGSFENHELAHHIGTFAFGISGEVFDDPAVLRFWERYRPYDLRPHCIHHGEIRWSMVTHQRGYRKDVIYSADRLALKLDAMDLPTLIGTLRYLPFGPFRSYDVKALLEPARQATLLRDEERRSAKPAFRTPTLSGYRVARTSAVQAATATEVSGRITTEVLVNDMMGMIINGSQVHRGAGIFHRVMDSPLIKKDLLMRGLFVEHDCARFLDYMGVTQRERILRELINRGRPVYQRGWRAFQIRHGLI